MQEYSYGYLEIGSLRECFKIGGWFLVTSRRGSVYCGACVHASLRAYTRCDDCVRTCLLDCLRMPSVPAVFMIIICVHARVRAYAGCSYCLSSALPLMCSFSPVIVNTSVPALSVCDYGRMSCVPWISDDLICILARTFSCSVQCVRVCARARERTRAYCVYVDVCVCECAVCMCALGVHV